MMRTYFIQECPTCGRTLHVQVKYLGRELTCQHCRGKLLARDPEDTPEVNRSIALLRRADELLGRSKIA